MRKNDLIKLLQETKGNPEIVLWNGIVGDYMQIDNKLVEGELSKMTFEGLLHYYSLERKRDKNDWNYELTEEEKQGLLKNYKDNYKWEINQFVNREDIKRKTHKSKRVLYINAKISGKSHNDRLGSIYY
jgi:hypothetical protein